MQQELKERGFLITDVENKRKTIKENGKYKRIPQPIFILTFQSSQNLKKEYDNAKLLNWGSRITTTKG
jgi:hypothetical protein